MCITTTYHKRNAKTVYDQSGEYHWHKLVVFVRIAGLKGVKGEGEEQ